MNIFLFTATDTITLLPEKNVAESKELILSRHTTLEGDDSFFKFGVFDKFNLPLRVVPFSDGLLMNEWWLNREQLTFDFDNSMIDVKIVSLTRPFTQIDKPYFDLWKGNLNLEQT